MMMYKCEGGLVCDKLLAISQKASYLQLFDKTVRLLINDHKFPASKVRDRVWRIKQSDEEYLQANTNGKKGAE
jgi:hypothetical protein